MGNDLWEQFIEYISSTSDGELLRWIGFAVGGAFLIIEKGQAILRGFDSSKPLGISYKIRAHKYLGLIDDVDALDSDNRKSAVLLKNALFEDLKVDIIHAYLDERYKRWVSRFTSELLLYSVAWFIVLSSVVFAENVLKLSEGKAIDFSDVKSLYALTVLLCSLVLILPLGWYILIELPLRIVRFLYASILRSRKKIRQLSLIAILSNLNPGQQYLFIDATVCSGFPPSPVIGNSNDVSFLACIEGRQRESLWGSELLQSLRSDADERIVDLVMSFLWEKGLFGKDLVCFVYSRYGLSAIQVTSVLRDRGFNAHYIGNVDGQSKELARAIKEVELLRTCGLK